MKECNYKISKVIEYCISNDIKFIWVNENNILTYINKEQFSANENNKKQLDKMLKGIENGRIKNKIN